jgi:hypothetical protein
MGDPDFKHRRGWKSTKHKGESPMRNIKLSKTIVLISAIALGCALVTADAFARGGVGGAAAGHAAPSGGAASGHAGAASRGAPASSVGHAHIDGSSFVHAGHGFAVE